MDRTTELTAEELLAHAAWLRRLARALVGDAAADDVVQDTYEVALSHPPRAEGALRPWLGGVARNLARMRQRAGLRRERREEQAPAIAAEPPTPAELVARATVQHRIAALVLELEEPLRATLMLRYYEGLSAADVARLQGVPAGTVRWRLKQAVDALRARLDDEHGDRKAWVLLLAPLAPPLVAAPGSSAVGSLVLKGLAVKTGIKVVALIAILVALVVGTRVAGLWGKPKPAPAVAKHDGAPPVERAGTPTPAAGGPIAASRAPVYRDDDPRGSLRLEGVVLDEADQGVAGARVAIDAAPPIVVTTDSDGSFTFEGLIARDYRVEATAGDRYAGPARLRLTDQAEPVTLRLRTGGVVEVAVSDRDGGKPIAGAEVELRAPLGWTGVTGADGVAILRGIGPTWAPLAVSAAGYAPAAVLVSTAGTPQLPERIAVVLARGASVAGRVVDEAGQAVAGARVSAALASEPFPVIDPRRDGVLSGGDGGFLLPALAAGTYRLSASDAHHAATTSTPVIVDGQRPRKGFELVMTAGGVIKGVVTDGAGQPVAAADVQVVTHGTVEWRPRRQAFTAADGTFAITGLPRRAVEVVAWHPSGASSITPVDLVAKAVNDVRIVLDVTGAIEGTVVDGAGEPVGDAQVVADPSMPNPTELASWQVRGVQQVVTDAGGKFRFVGLPAGGYQVRAARPAAPERALWQGAGVTARPGDPPLRITLAADGTITGKVAFADGTAAALFTIELGEGHAIPVSSKDGHFTADAPAGTLIVRVAGPGFVPKQLEATVASGEQADLGTITVAAGRSVSGRVVDASGVPVAGAKVVAGALLTGGGAELYLEHESIGARSTETSADGRYLIEGFSPHGLTVVAGKVDVGRSAAVPVSGGPDSVVVDLVLDTGGSVEGKVTRNGQPLGDTPLIANPIGAMGANYFVVTGADGSFAFDFLSPGPYLISPLIGAGGGGPKDMAMRMVTVTAGARATVTIDAPTGPGKLTIAVNTDQGKPVMLAQVVAAQAKAIADMPNMDALRDGSFLPAELRAGGTMMVHMRTAMGGPAEIADMQPGSYTVCAVPLPVSDPSQARLLAETAGTLPMKCLPVEVGATPQAVTVVVPVAWTQPAPAPPR